MKRISCWLLTLALYAGTAAPAQDAATEERLNKLGGRIDDLIAMQSTLKKQIAELSREVESLREQAARPNHSYASQDDLRRLAEALKEVDRKRIEDNNKVVADVAKDLAKVRKLLELPPSASPKKNTTPTEETPREKPATTDHGDKGFEYVIQKGDTLSVIVQAYREKNIKVTIDQILKANPGLKEKSLVPGKKIFIPAPAP